MNVTRSATVTVERELVTASCHDCAWAEQKEGVRGGAETGALDHAVQYGHLVSERAVTVRTITPEPRLTGQAER